MTVYDPPFRQLITARLIGGGTTQRIGWGVDTLAGAYLLCGVAYSGSASSHITTAFASTNPTSAGWGAPIVDQVWLSTAGLGLRINRLASAAPRFARDAATGAAFFEQVVFDVAPNSILFLAELDDIDQSFAESIGALTLNSGTSLTPSAVTTRRYADYVLGFHAHRNTDDQTATSPAVLPTGTGAGNPTPIGATVSPNQVSLAVSLTLPGATGSSVQPITTIGTSRNYIAVALDLLSLVRSRPSHGSLNERTTMIGTASPVMLGGSTKALVGVHRRLSWPLMLNGPEALAPTISNLADSGETQSTVDLAFDVNPGNLSTTLRIDYTTALGFDGTPNWSVGFSRTPLASPVIGAGDVHVVDSPEGLAVGTLYYWRVVATNGQGETDSDAATFTTLTLPENAPIVTTGAANPLVATAATLTGTINPQNLPTSYYFRFSTHSDMSSATVTTTQLLAAVDANAHGVAAAITGLTSGIAYYFQLHAYNDDAPEASGGIDGAIVTFTTPVSVAAPIVTTDSVTGGRAVQVVVAGTVDPNNASTTWKAQASTDAFATVAAQTSAVTLPDSTAGDVQAVSGTITGLTPGTAYTVRIQAINSAGTTNGSTLAITTEGLPTVSAQSAVSITATTASIQANIGHTSETPDTDVLIEWGLTSAYGSSATATVLHTDTDPKQVTQALSGLVASTTYHFRFSATRHDGDGGTIHGADATFATAASSGIPAITTPAAYGPSTAISVGLPQVTTPTYTVQVKADGTLQRSDTSAAITITGTTYVGGTLVIESDTPGTYRTPNASLLDQLRVHQGHLILRELTLNTGQGQAEVTSSPSDAPAITFEGCKGTFSHFRAVDCNGVGIRLTKSASGLYCGSPNATAAWTPMVFTPDPYNPVLTPLLRLENCTAHPHADDTGYAMLQIDAAMNVVIGGFDPGTQSTTAHTPTWAVRIDAALRTGGTSLDVQDVYLDTASDGTTVTRLHNAASTTAASLRVGLCRRSGVWNATSPNTAGQRPFRPLWFELANGTQPGSETAGNCTNDQVLAEAFVNRNWFTVNLVSATMRDGYSAGQQFEVACEVYDPAVSLALWTPDDLVQSWPNGAKRFIAVDGVKRTLGARPTLGATMPLPPLGPGGALVNKATIDATWTHMGGTDGDGVTVIKDVVFDPDQMVGSPYSTDVKSGAHLIVAPNASQPGGVAVVLDSTTPRTLAVTAPDGSAADLSKWANTSNGSAKTITTITNATPAVVAVTTHGYTTGDQIGIAGSSVGAYNGSWTITVIDANSFSLNGSTASGAATGGTSTARSSLYGIYTGYVDANLGANAVAPGIGYRRQLSYTGIQTGAFTGVLLVKGPSSTPAQTIGAAGGSASIGGEILRVTAGVAETFFPHGLPTGEVVTISSVPGLATGSYTVTRVDAFRFSINGQSGLTWAPITQVVGTYVPTTAHPYGLAGAQTSFAIPAGTTLDSTQNGNYGQLSNNAQINIGAGARLRFLRCALKGVAISFVDSTGYVEFFDCDHSVTPLPGGYDYDSPGNLGVPGTYDRFNQHLPPSVMVNLNVFSANTTRIRLTRFVATGAHGDVFPGHWGAGSVWGECYVDQAAPAGTNNDNSSNVRPGIGSQNLPKVAHMTHGDIAQFFEQSTALMRNCRFHTQSHSVTFSRLGDHYESHTSMTLAQSGSSGFYKATLGVADPKGFQNVSVGDTVLLKNAGSLNGLWVITAFTDKVGSKNTSMVLSAPYPASGSPTTCDMVHPVHVVHPGILRCRFGTAKYTNSDDHTHLTPIQAKGNVTISITTLVGSSPAQPIAGELDYILVVHDCGLDNGGSFQLSDPNAISPPHPEWVDLGTPNRNLFIVYSGSGVPAQTATPNYLASG